jgi:hypothetical protein
MSEVKVSPYTRTVPHRYQKRPKSIPAVTPSIEPLKCPKCGSPKLYLSGTYNYYRNGKKVKIDFIHCPVIGGFPEKDLAGMCAPNPSESGNAVAQHFLCKGCQTEQRLVIYVRDDGIGLQWLDLGAEPIEI